MPGKISARKFQGVTHQLPETKLVKPRPKTKLDPSDVFGTKGRDSKYHDAVMSDRQEGLGTGQLTDYNEQVI